MAYLPDPSKHAYYTEGLSMTETEHAKDVDINTILKRAARGLPVSGTSGTPQYGRDDTTLDGLRHRINLSESHEELSRLARENEFDEEELKLIPPDVQKKFGFKAQKKKPNPASQNDEKLKNDETKPPEPASKKSDP